MGLRISIILCVDPIVTLLCVKHNILQCFSTGWSKVRMQPKSGLQDRSERVQMQIVYSQRNDINKKRNSKCFSDARLLF